MSKISGVCVGESPVGDGNEVAHVDLLNGSPGQRRRDGLLQCADQQQGRLHHPACVGRAEPYVQAADDCCTTR